MYIKRSLLTLVMLASCAASKEGTHDHMRPSRHSSGISRTDMQRNGVVDFANGLIGTKYAYGGTSPRTGFDCSGFTSYVLGNFGWSIPRTSSAQAGKGRAIPVVEARPGDLVFFGKGKNVQHVGIVASRSAKSLFMIHSSSGRGVLKEDAMASEYWKKRVLYAVDLSSL